MRKILSIVGARPQFVKAVCISRAIKNFNKSCRNKKFQINEVLLHTDQHYDYNMSGIFFKELALKKPNYHLNVGSHSQGKQVACMLEGIEAVLKKERPDIAVVYGDTNSTLAGALAGRRFGILIAHVEAGLRSYNRTMPEEINRVVTDRLSDILFCPSKTSVENLKAEGIINNPKAYPRVHDTGDIMYDALLLHLGVAEKYSKILSDLSLKPLTYYLATIHRAENTDNPKRLCSILKGLNAIAKNKGPVVFPVHPRTKKAIASLGTKKITDSIMLINPVSYMDILTLEKNARAILTDSGGMQKEAYFLKVGCVTLRNETEWLETLFGGCNILAGADSVGICNALEKILHGKRIYRHIYGDGRAAEKMVSIINSILN